MDLTLKYQMMGFLDGIQDPQKKSEMAVFLELSFQYMNRQKMFNRDIGHIILPILKKLFLDHGYNNHEDICDSLSVWMETEAKQWHLDCPELIEEDFINLFILHYTIQNEINR